MKKRLRAWVVLLVIIICVSGVIYSCYNIFIWKRSINKNAKIKDQIDAAITIIKDENNPEDKYKVDFDKLKEQNPDTVAYLKINNTNIDYIVVKGKDNNYYLTHNFNKERNIAGWIFADYKNKFDGTDKNIVIFGHNMKDGSMFGTLKHVLNRNWQENKDNLQIVLVTEDETALYQVFSTYTIAPEELYINTEFNSEDEYSNFLINIKTRSVYDYNVEVDMKKSILTLSTCNADGTKRIVLHAQKIKNSD